MGQTATFGLDSNGMPVFLDKLRSYDDAEDNQQQANDIVMNEPQVKFKPAQKTPKKSKIINRKNTIPLSLSPVRSNNMSPQIT